MTEMVGYNGPIYMTGIFRLALNLFDIWYISMPEKIGRFD